MSEVTTAANTPAPEEQSGGGLGLPAAIALITGSIIGTGIFTLPAAIAKYGMVGLVGFVIATMGAIALGLCGRYLGTLQLRRCGCLR